MVNHQIEKTNRVLNHVLANAERPVRIGFATEEISLSGREWEANKPNEMTPD